MHNAYIVDGTLIDTNTVALDERVPRNGGRVRVVLEAPHVSFAHILP
ncbi:MAG: hypothetical protein GW893_09980 [Armatimonadetes bacterium]|nr:hypothetical protein [Armatimonadota bacterium]